MPALASLKRYARTHCTRREQSRLASSCMGSRSPITSEYSDGIATATSASLSPCEVALGRGFGAMQIKASSSSQHIAATIRYMGAGEVHLSEVATLLLAWGRLSAIPSLHFIQAQHIEPVQQRGLLQQKPLHLGTGTVLLVVPVHRLAPAATLGTCSCPWHLQLPLAQPAHPVLLLFCCCLLLQLDARLPVLNRDGLGSAASSSKRPSPRRTTGSFGTTPNIAKYVLIQ